MEELSADAKYTMLWLITNRETSVLGVCKVTRRRFSFETSLPEEAFEKSLEALKKPLVRVGEFIWLRSFIRHQFGRGEKLLRNNVFKTVARAFLSLQNQDLKALILKEYPELENAESVLLKKPSQSPSGELVQAPSKSELQHTPPQALAKGLPRTGEERRGEERRVSEDSLKEGSGEKTQQSIPESQGIPAIDPPQKPSITPPQALAKGLPSPEQGGFENYTSIGKGRAFKAAAEILAYLNEKSGASFPETSASLSPIADRLTEVDGDVEGVKQMIDRQVAMWADTPESKYLRPITLFCADKFSNYYGQRNMPLPAPRSRNGGPTPVGVFTPETREEF